MYSKNLLLYTKCVSAACVLECCIDHGLPQKCLGEDLNSKTVAAHNTSHLVVETVITKDCHKYHGIMEDCKSECLKTETLMPIARTRKYSFIAFIKFIVCCKMS